MLGWLEAREDEAKMTICNMQWPWNIYLQNLQKGLVSGIQWVFSIQNVSISFPLARYFFTCLIKSNVYCSIS